MGFTGECGHVISTPEVLLFASLQSLPPPSLLLISWSSLYKWNHGVWLLLLNSAFMTFIRVVR